MTLKEFNRILNACQGHLHLSTEDVIVVSNFGEKNDKIEIVLNCDTIDEDKKIELQNKYYIRCKNNICKIILQEVNGRINRDTLQERAFNILQKLDKELQRRLKNDKKKS